MKNLETTTQTTNQHLWQTFNMEEAMKKLPNPIRSLYLALVVALVVLFSACSQEAVPTDTEGLESQFGTSAWDIATDAAGTATGIYVIGSSDGALAGAALGDFDVYIRKYSFSGNVLWQRQFGTNVLDYASDIAIHNQKIYILGETSGAMVANLGSGDVFLRQYDDNGNLVWTRQFGTVDYDGAGDVATDSSGNAFVVSKRSNSFGFTIHKITPAGVVSLFATFNSLFNLIDYSPRAVAIDNSNNIYVLAYSNSVNRTSIFKYNSSGLYLGGNSSNGQGYDLTVLDNHIFVVGVEGGQTHIKKFPTIFNPSTPPVAVVSPNNSLFLSKIKASGGNLYLSGDGSAAKYSSGLVKQWEKKIGNLPAPTGYGLAVSAVSNAVYPVGIIPDTYVSNDGYIAKLDMTTGAVAWTR